MHFDLNIKEFRRLLDLVYMGNWVLNSTRGNDRFEDYDALESKLFGLCRGNGMHALVETVDGVPLPSAAYEAGGIHEAIAYYEDEVFYDILAEELALRDMGYPEISQENFEEFQEKKSDYLDEFEVSGLDHFNLEEP